MLGRIKAYPQDDTEYAGLYGYNDTYSKAQYMHQSSKFFIFQSEIKGQHRVYIADTTTSQVKMVRIPGVTQEETLRVGDYTMISMFEDTLILKYSEVTMPPRIYCIHFK